MARLIVSALSEDSIAAPAPARSRTTDWTGQASRISSIDAASRRTYSRPPPITVFHNGLPVS